MQKEDTAAAIEPRLGLWDAVSIIVGIVVGTAIFKTPQMVFANVAGPWSLMGVWALGGILSLVGALCYAELSTTYPRSGGDYVYLTQAYGRWVGFLFGWAQLSVLLTGSIGAMAYAFADYGQELWKLSAAWNVWLAVGSVVCLTVMNLFGVMMGKLAQNVLTAAKVLGLGGILVAGLSWGGSASVTPARPMSEAGFGLAMVFVLYAYGGWNDAAFVAAEVRNRTHNLPRALLFGIGGITVIYLLVNFAYMWGLGFDAARATFAPAAEVLQMALGPAGSKAMSLVVMISALGAMNGLILTGSRVYATLGSDHRVFAVLGRWNVRLGVPVWSLVAQGAISAFLILAVGTEYGRLTIDGLLGIARLQGLPWDQYFGGFNTLVAGTAPVFWAFFLLTGISLFVLREIDRGRPRPFSVPLFPVVPLVFCLSCAYMLYSALTYAKALSLLGIAPLLLGLPLYAISQRLRAK